jgi:hypothetical protein
MISLVQLIRIENSQLKCRVLVFRWIISMCGNTYGIVIKVHEYHHMVVSNNNI